MSKPLDLTIYPVWDDSFGQFYADKDDRMHPTSVDYERLRKRLTSVELAAEYWNVDGDYRVFQWDDSISLISEMRDTIYRFATTPHYDEVQP